MSVEKKSNGKFRLADLFVVLFCLTGAIYSINLFWADLFQTLNGRNKTPIGTVSIKRNIVQRRMSDRVIWDRLIKESPVYSNDMIRVGDNSEADLRVGGNDITINENTLLRLRYDKETGEYKIELTSGNLGLVTASEGGDVVLNIMGRRVKAKPGTALNAAAGNNGMELQVSEGAAVIAEEGQNRELGAGAAIAMDGGGSVRLEPAVFVIQPKPNALYRTGGGEPLNIGFSWNRINLPPNETLRLEIAEDQSFSRSVRTLDGLNSSALTALNAGLWNWRLIYNGDANGAAADGGVLASGRFTVTEASAPELLSPAKNRRFIYESELPKLYFQWSRTDDVSYYVAEVDVTPEFRNPVIKTRTTATSFSDSSLGEGIWYWRVTPVFSRNDENVNAYAVYPRPSAFHIIKNQERQTPSFTPAEEPAPVPTPAPANPARPKRVTLESPSAETALPGLIALRRQTVFRWSSDEAVAKSRFVLSGDSNPLTGQAVIEINDPNRTIRIDSLGEGVWYWTVEAQTPEGINISAQTPRMLRVLPIPLLSSPSDCQPAEGYRIGIEELKKVNIDFKWSAVQGANAYILTLYQESSGGRRQITRIGPENRTSWSTEIKTLGRGNFIWSVEAVNAGQNNVIEQHGNPVEKRFIIDIPQADPVKIIKGSEVPP